MSEILAYSIEGAAAAARLGRTQLYEAIKEGRLRARKSGRRTVILRDDLAAFLQALPERFVSTKSAGRRAKKET